MFDSINERVAHYRKLANLNQAQAAERMGMKLSTYSQMERVGNISGERIIKLAQIFGVDASILLLGETDRIPAKVPNNPGDTVLTAEQDKPVLPPVPKPFLLTNKEKTIITVIRNFSKKEQDEVIAFIESKRKRKKIK